MRNMVIYNDSYAMLFDTLSLFTSDCQIKLVSLYSTIHVFILLKDVPKQKGGSVSDQTKQVDILCKAYQGLVFYVEWMMAKNRHQKLTALGI